MSQWSSVVGGTMMKTSWRIVVFPGGSTKRFTLLPCGSSYDSAEMCGEKLICSFSIRCHGSSRGCAFRIAGVWVAAEYWNS